MKDARLFPHYMFLGTGQRRSPTKTGLVDASNKTWLLSLQGDGEWLGHGLRRDHRQSQERHFSGRQTEREREEDQEKH